MVVWVPIDAVIDLHAELLEEHGGAAGLRDRGALESALARPRQLQAYDPEADLYALAAASARTGAAAPPPRCTPGSVSYDNSDLISDVRA